MSLDKDDIQSVAEGRVYGNKGLGLIYRISSGVFSIITVAVAVFFILVDERSPFETVASSMPNSIQHAEPWVYYLAAALIGFTLITNILISRILEHRTRLIVDEWKKTGKFPERRPDAAVEKENLQ